MEDNNQLKDNKEFVIVTIRLIRSFEHRNVRNLVLRNVDLHQTVSNFIQQIRKEIQLASNLPPPFKKTNFDCLKIEHQPHGFKSNNPVINIESDRPLLDTENTLKESGIINETEISFFNRKDYENYKESPHLW